MDIPISYVAIVIAGIANMVVGFLWYGPLFGKTWANLMGWGAMTPEALAEKQKSALPGYAISFVGALIMAYVLSHVYVFAAAYLHTDGIPGGIAAAFWSWLGFVAPVTVGTVLWDGKPWKLWFINAGYYLVTLLLMGIVIGYFVSVN